MDYAIDQIMTYYLDRIKIHLQERENSTRCPFHEDRHPSMRINGTTGLWYCFGCQEGGGLPEFEMRLQHSDRLSALKTVHETLGIECDYRQEPEAVYSYFDEHGTLLYQKVRNWGKRFVQRRPGEKSKWSLDLSGVRRVLYNLAKLITSNYAIIVEGEKDADRLNRLDWSAVNEAGKYRVCATTNVGGASLWRPEYSKFFSGKEVCIIADNDGVGRNHADAIALSVLPFACHVKAVNLPDIPEKGDVSDFLDSHSLTDLLSVIRQTPIYKPAESELMIPAPRFIATYTPEINWLVEGVIERGANGFICGDPKSGKSWVANDLAIALAAGNTEWSGFRIPRSVRVGLISREDNPGLTRWRMGRLLLGRAMDGSTLADTLWVNTREQSPSLRLDNETLAPMVAEIKKRRLEFVILDVFNVLHCAEENDATEMRAVMDSLSSVQRDTGASIAVVHHFTKNHEGGSLTKRLRGSSAIAGWAEWIIGVGLRGEDRVFSFELKASSPPPDRQFTVFSDESIARIIPGEVAYRENSGRANSILQ